MTSFRAWQPRLEELVDGIHDVTRHALLDAIERDDPGSGERPRELPIDRPVGVGVGDVTFGLDAPAEAWIDRWLVARATEEPLSVLTEDRGWRHMGPSGELTTFDHGGPHIAIDPIDGTRNLMVDLRSAWTVVSFAPAGQDMPRIGDLTGGIVSEIPTSRARGFRTFVADGRTCESVERDVSSGECGARTRTRVDDDDRADNGYFPFFRYKPDQRPAIADLEARFFDRLEKYEGADLRSVYDDQYISNAGQLVLVLTGTYRMIVDARALVARRAGVETVTSKPYDVGGAIVCARSAGAVVTAADGSELDFPMDAETPVDMAAYANAATCARLAPHWMAVLAGR